MAYVIKIGDEYVTPDGGLSTSQSAALRIDDSLVKDARTDGKDVRTVHLKARGTNNE